MDPRELLQHIDACRPGGDELQDADMAPLAALLSRDAAARALAQRVQAADAKIAAALRRPFHEVPDGLEARLLAAVRDQVLQDHAARERAESDMPGVTAARTAVLAGAAGSGVSRQGLSAPAAPPANFSWRRALIGTSLVAAVAVLAVYVMNLPRPITADEVVEEVRHVYDKEVVRANDWNTDLTSRPGADFAVPVYALNKGESFQAQSPWRAFTFWNSDAVAYDLHGNPAPDQRDAIERGIALGVFPARAVLFVIDRRVFGLPTSPPDVPQGQSVGPVIGVWRSESVIYALSVEGREGAPVAEKIQLYRDMLREGDLARRWIEDSQAAAR